MGIVILDAGRRVVHWNSWMRRHSGVPRRVAVGADLFCLFPEICGGRLDLAVSDALTVGLSAVISHQVNTDLFPLMRRDGLVEEPVAQSILLRPVPLRGGNGCLIQVFDQTAAIDRERKLRAQRNARYHAIVETARDCFVTVDEGGLIQAMNPATEVTFGIAAAAAVGQPITALLPGLGDIGELDGSLLPWPAIGADGRPFDAEISFGGWTSNGLRYHTLFIRDVTERNQAAEELRRSQRLQALGKLTGGIAHEFNNLLMVVRANAELLQQQIGHSAFEDLVTEILVAVDRGRGLTDGLLSFARKRSLRPEPVALEEVVADTLRLSMPSMGANIAVIVDPQQAGLCALADRAQLQNALLNLLINARDAMPDGGFLVIWLSEDEDEGYCRIALSDTGTGMTAEILDRACEPFFTTKGPRRGTGLGLSMVAGFARQSGGSFELHSVPGAGTTAVIRLKRANGSPQPARDASREAVPHPPLPKLRILVVEDDPPVLKAIQGMLIPGGHEIVVAPDGLTAMDHLSREDFDLLLTDVVLPRSVSGFMLVREVLRFHPTPGIVMMSGHNEHLAEYDEILRSVEILHKPFALHELLSSIRSAIDGAAHRR